MSKEQDHVNDRIPSYEESIAHQGTIGPAMEKSPRLSIQQRNRLKRTRLVNDLTCSQIEPAVSRHLEDGIGTTVAILIPSDILSSATIVSTSNITSPALPSNINLLRLSEDEYKSSFLHQPAVLHDLASALTASLVDPTQLQLSAMASTNLPPTEPLPARPQPDQRKTLKYMAGIADSDKDPTGSTGSWNLGWRDDSDPAETAATVHTDEVTVSIRLQDITFRIENEMGLLDSATIKCVWCAVELKG
ncbi:hypothetical protein DV737_g4018, partial [Chaetothyriales sp. CBS 132003]